MLEVAIVITGCGTKNCSYTTVFSVEKGGVGEIEFFFFSPPFSSMS